MGKRSKISKLRILRSWRSIKDVSDELGISASSLSAYENGTRTPRDMTKIKIANFYNKTVQEIFFDNKDHD